MKFRVGRAALIYLTADGGGYDTNELVRLLKSVARLLKENEDELLAHT